MCNHRLINIILTLVIVVSFNVSVISQNDENHKVKLTDFLSKLSEEYKIFFTYDTKLLQDKFIDTSNFKTTNIAIIINRLRTLTNLHYDNLGNNYYVIYNDSDKGKAALQNAKDNLIDFQPLDTILLKNVKNYTLNGRVIDILGNSLFGASVVLKNTTKGTITNINGNFSLIIEPGNKVLTISFIGYTTRDYYLQDKKQVTIILEQGEYLDEVQVVGSRNTNRTAVDTPSAIDVINIENATDKSGQLEINQLLQYIIPSFNASKQSGADGADHVDPATLRGLGPDQTLVLINGKRRHQSSLVNLYGTRGRGNSGTDLNAIPIAAIKKIEVLRDGASAQYGSDAIAGVINIVLKDNIDAFTGNITYGLFNANANANFTNPTSGVDGNTIKLSGNYGMKISKKGFLNLTTEVLSKDNTLRPGADFRKKYGGAGLDQYSFFINSETPLNNKLNFYINGGYSYRDSESYAFTRNADSPRNIIEIYPNGFDPLITATINDQSLSTGIKTKFSGWNIDINNTYGSNNFHYFIKETLNATLEEKSPTSFDAGGHILRQNTTSADFTKYYSKILKGINIAFGTEFRIENYKIFTGDVGSYAAFDVNGNIVDQNTAPDDLVMLNGVSRPGGSQGFPGYSIDNEVDRTRSNLAAYIDTEFDFTDKFMVGFAGRYEKYSDFGNTFNTKFSTIYKATENFNVRSSFSTGFRAPSLAQIYYNLKFTNFIGSVPSESLLVPNDSPITRDFNIGSLIEERAINASFGFTAKIKNFNATVDGYLVNIKDRIILTGNFDATGFDADINDVQFFANGVDTNTLGLDIIFTWHKDFGKNILNLSFAGNINEMSIEKIKNRDLDQETFFGTRDQFFLLASAPKSKFNFNLNFKHKKVTANLSLTRFSKIELVDWQIIQPTQSEDPSSSFVNEQDRFNKAKDIYNAKLTTDINTSYAISDKITLRAGANNLFNIYPTIQQNKWTDGGGYWDAVQMGTNGSFYYSRLTYKF
jgi:iron complex outermembrane receptor protein